MKKIAATILCFCAITFGFAQNSTVSTYDKAENLSEGYVYVHTARNNPIFKRDGKEIKVERGDLLLADNLTVECLDGQYATLIFSNRNAIYISGKSKMLVEKFEQVTPFRSFLTDEHEATRSILRISIDYGTYFMAGLTPRPTSRIIIKTKFGTLEPQSCAYKIACTEKESSFYILDGQAIFIGLDNKKDFIQQAQIATVEAINSSKMYPLSVTSLSMRQEEEFKNFFSLCKSAISTVEFSFNKSEKIQVKRLIPKEFFIKKARFN